MGKSIQFPDDGWSCVPSLLFIWDQTMVEVMKTVVTSFKRSHACTATPSAPIPAAGYHRPMPPLETPGHSTGKSGSVSHGVTAPLSWVLAHTRFHLCPPGAYFLVLWKLWQLYGGVNGDLLQEELRHTHTQSPSLQQTTADPHLRRKRSQFCLSLCGVPGSWCTQGLLEPS